jgi:hypothetical protein
MLLPAAIATLTGILLLFLAMKGSRIDDHPVCRHCRFDLIGLPSSDRCSECGAHFVLSSDIRIGNRRPRPRLRAVALLLIITGLGLIALSAYQTNRAGNAAQWKPGWWLRADLRGHSVALAKAAVTELSSRQAARELSPSQRTAAARAALDRQADPALSWDPAFGDFIEAARTDGALAGEDWTRYARHAAVISIKARPVVRQGDTPALDLNLTTRAGSGPTLVYSLRGTSFKVGDQALGRGVFVVNSRLDAPFGPELLQIPIFPSLGVSTFVSPDLLQPGEPDVKLAALPGPHTLESSWLVSIHEALATTNPGAFSQYGWETTSAVPMRWTGVPARAVPLVQFKLSQSTSLQVVPAETQTVELVTQENLAAAVQASLTPKLYFEPPAAQPPAATSAATFG